MQPDPTMDTNVQIQNSGNDLVIAPGGSFNDLSQAVGAPSLAGVTAVENGVTLRQTTLNINQAVTMTDHTTAGNQGSIDIYDFPAGNVLILGAETDVQLTISGSGGISATGALVASLGTVAAAITDATLTSTEANIVPSNATTLVGGTVAFKGRSTAPVTVDGTVSHASAFLNLAVPDAGSTGNDTITAVGTVTLTWLQLGDS